ncbi:hypothetical protein PspR84_01780 [Pseudomonas sp. R84]|uniref:hypothetical protein n=1 Tax=Pseudomonas sp. R84 TaxID=1573712 RepID=UPI00131FAC6F|nr:hypothetical protein [Pseudomonas sp. R84]QHC93409.1 hypothetical protein PspR84_01780 [Pseudomonas sp. R84]
MLFDTITSLQIINVFDHGVPNMERIGIYVKEPCDLGEYCLFIGLPAADGSTSPIKDHMLWFGNGFVNPGDWLFVYTASGNTTIHPNGLPSAGSSISPRLISIHWGKDHTIFQNRALVPMLIRMNGLSTPAAPKPSYQGPSNLTQHRLF